MEEEDEISLWKKSMEFPFQSHLKLTSAEKDYIISQVATSLWSGGDNSMPGKQLNPQIQCHIINTCRMKKNRTAQFGPDEDGRVHTGLAS